MNLVRTPCASSSTYSNKHEPSTYQLLTLTGVAQATPGYTSGLSAVFTVLFCYCEYFCQCSINRTACDTPSTV